MPGRTEDRTAMAAVAIAAAVQLGAIVVVLALRFLDGGAVGDWLGAVPLAVVYGLPGVLAALALRRRPALLLAAGIASGEVAAPDRRPGPSPDER